MKGPTPSRATAPRSSHVLLLSPPPPLLLLGVLRSGRLRGAPPGYPVYVTWQLRRRAGRALGAAESRLERRALGLGRARGGATAEQQQQQQQQEEDEDEEEEGRRRGATATWVRPRVVPERHRAGVRERACHRDLLRRNMISRPCPSRWIKPKAKNKRRGP